ncbi:LOW QUALITY PROTEIN: protein kinase [Schistosoma mansoni]|uniref:protein kinase n=1 Tax=Schistosoma mansoni TaxID=6183 RepID=UPI00022C8256|nr:LOW QUALITY PROTEIN: protein kinase [Schistosoma mansoni]|eukprot:XP_018645624.1 LOW QUALITY PROTEIN: protein kinase [Schistosoma mansoni]
MTKICSSNKYKLQIKQALDGNFIVLYQPAPNSFIIIQKNEGITHNKIDHNIHQESEHHDNLNSSSINTNDCQSKYHSRRQRRQRFRVVIGPQLCNCQNEIMRETGMIIKLTEPCVHLLFVMLHVLKIPSDDPHLSAIPLPSSKAEFWIEKYQNHRHSLVQSYNKNRRNSNTLKNEGNQSETLKFSEKLINSEMSNTRLIIPQPIRHEKTSNFLHLRALMNPSAYDSSELSSITQDIVPVSRRETESAGTCDPSTSCTTATSRTSSIDSIESCKLDSSCRSNDQHCRPRQPTTFSCSSNSETALSCRRPQTAPQPELPPRLGRTRAKFVRHSASSTTFRPVRDCSPLIIREGCLTPIESEENSTNNSLKYRTPMTSMNKNTTTIYTDNYDKLQEPLITTIPAITNKLSHSTTASDLLHGPTPRSNFTHARRSSFKPTTPMKQKFSFHNTPINLPLITNNQTSTTVNHVNTFNSTPASKQHICPPSLQQQTSVHVTGTAITSTNNTTVLDESAKICNLCLRNCHVETTINSSNHNGNNLIVDSGGNINLIDPILVCQSVLPDYDDDSNDSGINNEKKATFICGAIFHTSCCKIWLEEIQSDGDSPQCPVCGCVWIHIPSFDSHAKCDKFDEFDKNSDHTKCICCLSSSEQINNQQTDNNNDQQMKNNQQDDQHQSCHKYHNQNNEQQQMNETLRFTYQPVNLNADLNLTENMTVVKTLLPDPPFSEYNSCVSAFSVEMLMDSCDWTVRQYALQKATHLTISQVILARQCNLHSSHNNLVCSLNHHDGNCATPAKCQLYTGPDYVKIMFKLIQFLLDDPVDAIFTDALRAFRELLGYLVAYNKETQTVLQKAIGPILRRLLRFVGGQSNLWNLRNPESFLPLATHQQNDDENKTITNCNPTNNNSSYLAGKKSVNCQLNVKIDENNLTKATNELSVTLPKIPADANFRDRCNLALATLIELAKGQSGALAIGREVHSGKKAFSTYHYFIFILIYERTLKDSDFLCTPFTCYVLIPNFPRHLLPLYPKPDNMTMCFPYHYQLQSTDTHCGDFFSRLPPSSLSSAMRTIKATTTTADQHQHQNELNNVDYYHYTQYKANRIARRVFLTAARALLTWQSEKIFDRYDPIPPSTFNANSFIESEINRLDAPLATWFRNRLCLLLYSSNETSNVHRITKNNSWNILLSNHLPTDVKQSYATPSNTEALALSSTSPYITCPTYNKNISKVEKSNGMDDVNSSKDISSQQQRYEQKGAHNSLHSLGEELSFNNASSSSIKIPPIPPPRRLTISRSLGSEADLQCEQVTVLRNALTRSTHQLKPLLPIPGLSFVMSSFQQTKKLPNSDEYYESVDWIRGPILGHGAFSQCYQARDVRTGLLLAVKRIRLGRNAEVETEVRIMLQLDHPNILRLFGAVHCVKRGFVDLFIEWMPGGSITSLLQQYGAFNESITLNYGIQLIRGLAYLHKHGILHRDLKGANLLIDSTGTVIKISDFGASARLSGEQSVAGQFQGQVIGTFSFMAPEVLRGETYGRACDIWSVGCCLVEMLTSKPPWHDARLTNRFALMFTIATSNSPPTYPKDLTTDLIAVLDACFARNPSDRPTANQLLTYNVFARLISQQQSVTALEQGKQASILSSVSTSPNAMKTLKNTDKSVKCQINSMKSSTKSSFSYQRLFKTFQSSKISSTMNDKKVIVVEEAENEESDDDGEGCVGNFESDSTALATSTHLKHIQHHSDKHRLQKQHNQHLDDSGLLTRRRKTRRPTLPPLNFRRKYHPHTPVVSPSFK